MGPHMVRQQLGQIRNRHIRCRVTVATSPKPDTDRKGDRDGLAERNASLFSESD